MSWLRFLPGILALEMVAAIFAFVWVQPAANDALLLPLGLILMIVTLLAAVWFGSIADHVRKDALAKTQSVHARERESLAIKAEAEKRSALEHSHLRIMKETARAQAQANWRLGLGLGGLVAVGGILLAIEFMTVGLLVMATAGGALGGYLTRARQESRWLRRADADVPLLPERTIKTIGAPRPRRKSQQDP
jgi:Flp pilus assembly protein TadB